MRVIDSLRRRQTKRWMSLGLLAAVVLVGAVIANAEKEISKPFQLIESGINHCQMPCDSHHLCGMGMNSVLGHYTATIALVTPNKGIIEYRFQNGDAVYGTVDLQSAAKPGLCSYTINFTKGTGRFTHVSGRASGVMQCTKGPLGVETYTAKVAGDLGLFK
jgi:hypothetical protein